jgi:hypothetical protein
VLSTDFNDAFLAGAFLADVPFLIGTVSCRARLVDAATARAVVCSLEGSVEGGVTKSLSD